MKKILFIIFTVLLLTNVAPGYAGKQSHEQQAYDTVAAEVSAALSGKSAHAGKVSRYTNFYRDLLKLLRKHSEIGTPKPLKLDGKTVKILVPLNLDQNKVGGFFQVSADGKKIISYLIWKENLEPLFIVERQKWEKAASADELEELKELIPLKEGYSAGTPVNLSDLTDVYMIDYVDQLPSKTQEELEAYTSKNGLKSSLGRRTGSSKCLSYSASLASDWWNIAQGNKLGSYNSFVNGAKEYGINPRLVESLYFKHPQCPYSFLKETGKDRVTGEKIPYSPKHYAYIMSRIELPDTIKDPLKGKSSYQLPKNGFGMDLPFDNSFNKSNGKVSKIRSDLEKYGIIYAQHTSRLFNNKISLTFQGVHAVNIVGTARLNNKPVVLYYETFGKNSKEYLEDSFYGPSLRAFPVKFFYQGIYFPHRIIPEIKIETDKAVIRFVTAEGKKIAPAKLNVKVNDKNLKVKPDSFINVPLSGSDSELSLEFSRKYFYTPEEAAGYKRSFIISGRNVVELGHYEAMLKALSERRSGLFAKIFGKNDSYSDYLTEAAQNRYLELEKQLKKLRNNNNLISRVAQQVNSSKVLRKSALGNLIKEISTFEKINKK